MQGSPSLGRGLGGREGDTHAVATCPQAQGIASCSPPHRPTWEPASLHCTRSPKGRLFSGERSRSKGNG